MLYFLLFAVVLIPICIRLSANTENEALIIQADFMLPFNKKIKLYSGNITVKKIIASVFSRRKKKSGRAPIFNIVKKHSRIKKLNVKSRIGTGDASSTAMISGGVLGVIAPFATKTGYSIDIIPVFEEAVFDFSGECFLKTNLLNTIIAILKIFGGKKNGKASD